MSDKETKNLCQSCIHSIWCPTWGEWKCKAKLMRIYKEVTECDSYKKRGKLFKESKCQCEDCLKNEKLAMDQEEE
jgi:hypothetical protein